MLRKKNPPAIKREGKPAEARLLFLLRLLTIAGSVGGSSLPFGLSLGRINLAGFTPLVAAGNFTNRHGKNS